MESVGLCNLVINILRIQLFLTFDLCHLVITILLIQIYVTFDLTPSLFKTDN